MSWFQRRPLFEERNRFREDASKVERNPYARFRRDSSSGKGRHVITGKSKMAYLPYLSTDCNLIRACTTGSLGGTPQTGFEKKSDQLSRRRCDNETVTVLSKGGLLQRWLPFDHISWRTGIVLDEAHLGVERNSYATFRRKFSAGYGGDAITGKIQYGRWRPYLWTDRNQIWACTLDHQGNIPDKFRNNLTSGLAGDAITRDCLQMFERMDIWWVLQCKIFCSKYSTRTQNTQQEPHCKFIGYLFGHERNKW